MKFSLGYVSLPMLAGAVFSLASCTKPVNGNARSTTDSAKSNVNVSAKPTVSVPQIPDADKYIDVVRQGTMTGYDTTTIGRAFEATFRNSKWESGETSKGVTFVEFTGMLPENLYKEQYESDVQQNLKCVAAHPKDKEQECLDSPPGEEIYAKARFQWTFTVDGKSFELTYMDTTPWERAMGDFSMLSVAGYRDETTQDFIGGSEYIGKRRVPVTKRTISTDKVLAFIYH
jgi:hypothetical protein